MKVLILGGTGAMGKHLVQLLAEENIETFVTSRINHESFGTVHYIQGNAHDISFITTLLIQKYDVIIDFMIYSTVEFSKIVQLYLDNTEQYIFLSSARVYADSTAPLTENSPRLLDVSTDEEYLSTDEYALSKARQENILFNSRKSNWTIIRPYITYSENRLQLGVLEKEYWLYRALYGHTVVFSEDIMKKTTTLTYGCDVAKGIKSLINNEKSYGQVFNITHNKYLKWSDVWDIYKEIISKQMGNEPKIKLCKMKTFQNVHKGYYQIHFDRMYNRIFDNTKINQYMDTCSFLDPYNGLRKSLEYYITHSSYSRRHRYGSEGHNDFVTKEFWSISDIKGLDNKLKYLIRRVGL